MERLFIAEETHSHIKLFVFVTPVHNLAQGLEDMRATVVTNVHGDSQYVSHIARVAGEEANSLHGEIDTH